MIAAILGFMPALDRRLSIASRSGIAAKVVPNPATTPTSSERRKLGKSKLFVSCGIRPSHPERKIRLGRKIASVNDFNRCIFQPHKRPCSELQMNVFQEFFVPLIGIHGENL